MLMKKLTSLVFTVAGLVLLAGCATEAYVTTPVTYYDTAPIYIGPTIGVYRPYHYPYHYPYYYQHRPYYVPPRPHIAPPPNHNGGRPSAFAMPPAHNGGNIKPPGQPPRQGPPNQGVKPSGPPSRPLSPRK